MGIITKAVGVFAPRLIAQVGHGTRIRGRVERRAPRALVRIGCDCLIAGVLVAERDDSRLTIGDNVFIGAHTLIDCASEITIENDVLISYQVIIMDSDNHSLRASERVEDLRNWRRGHYDWTHVPRRPIRIRGRAWIGARAIIAKGVEIGEGGVVAAGAVVTRNVEPYTVVAGNPARVVRELDANER